jgi:2,3-bisphosphoglycerate-dependent phosphoglycerate mutase
VQSGDHLLYRSAEINTMSTDVALSAAGKQRAEALKETLKNKSINFIYSTNYIRTKNTAQPLADAINIPVQVYNPADTSFITKIKSLGRGNVLIVGHSNTVDDLVNRLLGTKQIAGDLQDSEYGDLFVVKRKKGKYSLERKRFGD